MHYIVNTVSDFLKLDIEGFALCLNIIGPCEFVIEMDSEVTGDFFLGIMSLFRVMGGGSDLYVEKKLYAWICMDLF